MVEATLVLGVLLLYIALATIASKLGIFGVEAVEWPSAPPPIPDDPLSAIISAFLWVFDALATFWDLLTFAVPGLPPFTFQALAAALLLGLILLVKR